MLVSCSAGPILTEKTLAAIRLQRPSGRNHAINSRCGGSGDTYGDISAMHSGAVEVHLEQQALSQFVAARYILLRVGIY